MFDALATRSLRDKLILAFLLPTLLLVSLNGALTYWVARSGLEEELGSRLIAIGQTLSAELSGGVEANQLARMDASKVRTRERLAQRLIAIQEQTGARRLFIFDEEMNSLVDTDPQVSFHQKLFSLEADRFEIARVFEDAAPTTSVLFSDEDGTRYKTAYVPILHVGEGGEPDQVVAALGVEASASFFDLLTDFASGLSLLALFGLALVILVGVFFARQLTRPVNELVLAARRLESGDLDAPIIAAEDLEASGEGDELASLRVSFEEMRRSILGRDRQMQMMLSGIAHEVRNPLGGMELFCGLLREDLEWDDPVDPDKIEKVDRIRRELNYLNKVVTDFLDFARHRPLELERVPALTLAQEIERLLSTDAAEQSCQIALQIGEVDQDTGDALDEELEITADRERLRRAIINTIRNAWQASPDGGQITLRVTSPTPLERVVEIEDEGQGIPEEKLAEILTPFFTTREKGSGLGLALTQKIIEQHGGQMEILSTVGEGTRVRFILPFNPDVEQAEVAEAHIPEGWLG